MIRQYSSGATFRAKGEGRDESGVWLFACAPSPISPFHFAEMLQLNHASQPGKGGREGSGEAFVNRARRRARGDTAGREITWHENSRRKLSGMEKKKGAGPAICSLVYNAAPLRAV